MTALLARPFVAAVSPPPRGGRRPPLQRYRRLGRHAVTAAGPVPILSGRRHGEVNSPLRQHMPDSSPELWVLAEYPPPPAVRPDGRRRAELRSASAQRRWALRSASPRRAGRGHTVASTKKVRVLGSLIATSVASRGPGRNQTLLRLSGIARITEGEMVAHPYFVFS